jgi:hypothetical protein
MAANEFTVRTVLAQPSLRMLTTLGRFLALAEMAGDPLYRLSNDDIVQRMKEVAADYETVKQGAN